MILIADSGSTKTHWKVLVPNGAEQDFYSKGLNPYHHGENFAQVLSDAIPDELRRDDVLNVFFYGAGCGYQQMQDFVASNLKTLFGESSVEVNSDLMGAARSLFANKLGIVLILGTGSNVGFYDGDTLSRQTASLGYVLGDEGSGTHLGKEFIKRWMYGDFPKSLTNQIAHHCPLTIEDILEKVYTSPAPAAFLAGFTDIIAKLLWDSSIANLVDDCFVQLVERHLLKYSEFTSVPIGVVGSVGVVFGKQLQDVLKRYGARLDIVHQFPIDGLATYHKP